MAALTIWCGFFGSWLLVAGPLLQGVLELQDQGIEREEIEAATAGIVPGPRPSRWWWLLPPIMIGKLQRRNDAFWREALAALPAEQAAQIMGVRPRIYGWFIVSLGAAFIAAKETGELAEHYHWPVWVFAAIMVTLGALAILNANIGVIRRVRRDRTAAPRA